MERREDRGGGKVGGGVEFRRSRCVELGRSL